MKWRRTSTSAFVRLLVRLSTILNAPWLPSNVYAIMSSCTLRNKNMHFSNYDMAMYSVHFLDFAVTGCISKYQQIVAPPSRMISPDIAPVFSCGKLSTICRPVVIFVSLAGHQSFIDRARRVLQNLFIAAFQYCWPGLLRYFAT